MAHKFIDLDRSFIPVSRDYSVSDEEHDYAALFGMAGGKKWNDLLELPRVIILAEAGAGKTAELQAIIKKLHAEKKAAFFLRLEYLAAGPDLFFEKGLGSKAEFDRWILSDEKAWFFLDSVDEAKLGDPIRFDLAIQRFAQQLGSSVDRAHLYITSRVSEWYAQHDLSLVESCFTPDRPEVESDGADKPPENENLVAEIFTLAPLNSEQIRTFSEQWGVEDVGGLLTEIDHSETDIFCRHPEDLIEVLEYWRTYGKINSRLELLGHRVASKLKENSSKREQVFRLSAEKAGEGAELVAASVTLQQTSRILIPDNEPSRKLRPLTIDPRDVLSDWTANEIGALLQRSIFDPAVYGTVRFHHRSAREYLTACWFKRLLDNGKSRQRIEAVFFADRYGESLAVPSMRPILAWLVLLDDKFRSKTAKIAPEVFLQGGDPSSLPVMERAKLLRMFCGNMSANSWQWHSFDWSDVRRFAHKDLAATISELLDKYSDNEEICRLLLRMISQKEITACADAALKFVLDDGVGRRLKSYAIWAVGSAGERDHKEQVRKWILSDPKIVNDDLVGDAIDACCPEFLTISEAVLLLSRIKDRPEFSHKSIDRELETLVTERCSVDQLLPFLVGILNLLKEKPLVDKRYSPYSKRYEWLLPFAALAAERLVQEKHPDAFNRSVFSAIMLSAANRRYSYVLHEGKLAEVIPAWKEFNHALFWHQVHAHRRRRRAKQISIIHYWQLRIHQEYWQFDISDFELVLDDIQKRRSRDDRLMAVSLAFEIYRNGGRPRKERERLKKTVAGDVELEQALHELLNPPKISEEYRKERRNASAQRGRWEKQREDRNTNNRKWLIKNARYIHSNNLSKTGSITQEMALAHKSANSETEERGPDRWSSPCWKGLTNKFSAEVAEIYRDACIGYWRLYLPEVRSDGRTGDKTPWGVLIGLSGLNIESTELREWPQNLSEDEARLASRYAVNEMNGFPEWLSKLHEHFPEIVKDRLLAEIGWEFNCSPDGQPPFYVLDDIKYNWKEIVPAIAEDLFGMLEKLEPHFAVTRNVIELISIDGVIDKNRVASLAHDRFKKSVKPVERAFWLAVWFRSDASEALRCLEKSIQGPEDEESAGLVMNLLLQLVGRHGETVSSAYADYTHIDVLSRLVSLAYEYVPFSGDNMHESGESFSPDFRDRVGDARSGLFSQLCNLPGKATYIALCNISKKHPEFDFRSICRRQAKVRAENDAEVNPWNTKDIFDFAKEAECAPKTHRDLFELTVSRLADLKLDLEGGDESPAEVWRDVKDEVKHRKMIGGWLREHSCGRYSVSHEEELADGKKPDIRTHVPEIDAPVPVELKMADNWSATEFAERLKNQLCGQYLRDKRSSCGVFLVVYRGEKNYWQHPKSKKRLGFDELTSFLENEARNILRRNFEIEAIEVVGIDLSKRTKAISLS